MTPKRHRPSTALPLCLLASQPLATLQAHRLDAHPSRDAYVILHEESIRDAPPVIRVASDVPVTIQRIPPDAPHVIAGDPVRVVVTSDCDTTQTTVIPRVQIDDGFVRIRGGAGGSTTEFLESSWYRAAWSRVSVGCYERHLQSISSSPSPIGENDVAATSTTTPPMATVNNYCGKTWLDAYANCTLACPLGNDDCIALGDGYTCQQYTTCYDRIQAGTFIPPNDGGGSAATVAPEKENVNTSSTAQAGTISTTLPTLEAATTTQGEIMGNGTDESSNTIAPSTFPTFTQVVIVETTANATLPSKTSTIATTTASDWTSTIPSSTIGAPVDTNPNAINATNETNDWINSTQIEKPTVPPAIYNFPTYKPTASHPPSSWTYVPTFVPTTVDSSSSHRAFVTRVAMLLLALGTVAVFMSGRDDIKVGHGKVAMAVAIVASLYSSFHTKGTIQNTGSASNVPSRQLPTCRFHVEILLNCNRAIDVEAPVSRVIYGRMEEVHSIPEGEDECVTNYSAKLMFPSNNWINEERSTTLLERTC
ncbi:hypothetical protein ACHAW6_001817 [Cyclotella cf. meneghiniana]